MDVKYSIARPVHLETSSRRIYVAFEQIILEMRFTVRFSIACFYLFSSLFFSLATPSYAHDHEWHVKADDFRCVQQQVEKYLQQQGDQILIFIVDCPDIDIVASLQKRVQNSSGSDVKLKTNTPERPAEVITFSRSELLCVAKIKIEEGRPVIAIPKNPSC
ncbi:MAG: hypothetical protein AAGE89_04000 [Pseudomonadota bacterium]